MAVLGGEAVSYERGTPVACETPETEYALFSTRDRSRVRLPTGDVGLSLSLSLSLPLSISLSLAALVPGP